MNNSKREEEDEVMGEANNGEQTVDTTANAAVSPSSTAENVVGSLNGSGSPNSHPSSVSTPSEEVLQSKQKDFEKKISDEIAAIVNGTHKEFIDKCQQLKLLRDDRVSATEKFRDIQLQNITNICESEIQQANSDYDNEISQIRERMLNMLMDKQKRGYSHQDAENFDYNTFVERERSTRKLRKRKDKTDDGVPVKFSIMSFEKYTKKKQLPEELGIRSFSLTSDEISQDLNQIQRGRNTSRIR